MAAKIHLPAIAAALLLAGGWLASAPNSAQAEQKAPARSAVHSTHSAARVHASTVDWRRGRYYGYYYGPNRYRYAYPAYGQNIYRYRYWVPRPYYLPYYGYNLYPGYYSSYYYRQFLAPPYPYAWQPPIVAPPATAVVPYGFFYW